jgi:hypothetical protein
VNDGSRREKRRTFLVAIGVGLAVFVIAAPFATALAPQPVKITGQPIGVKGKVQITASAPANKVVESQTVAPMGLAAAPGSPGALAVRTYGGGGGFLGAGDCTATDVDGLDNVESVTNKIITGIIITGDNPTTTPDGLIRVTSDFVDPTGQLSLANFRVNAANPQVFIGLGNGLTATDAINFTGTAAGGGPGSCKWILIGQNGV